MTEIEETVIRLNELRELRKELERGIESIRNYYMKNPFFRRKTTLLFWGWGIDTEMSYELRQEFRDFLTQRLSKTDKDISRIECLLKKAVRPTVAAEGKNG